MNKLEQAARQILEALEGIGFVSDYWNEKVTALREALAEPDIEEMTLTQIAARHEQAEQEPVAVVKRQVGNSLVVHITGNVSAGDLLYTRPVCTKDLTDDEVLECGGMDGADDWAFGFARAVIEKFKRKNNAA